MATVGPTRPTSSGMRSSSSSSIPIPTTFAMESSTHDAQSLSTGGGNAFLPPSQRRGTG